MQSMEPALNPFRSNHFHNREEVDATWAPPGASERSSGSQAWCGGGHPGISRGGRPGPVSSLPDEAVEQLDCVSEKGEATKWDLIKVLGNDAQFRK